MLVSQPPRDRCDEPRIAAMPGSPGFRTRAMISAVADAAARRYGIHSFEAAASVCRPAPGEKTKVGTTLTLVFQPPKHQSWYDPHFENRRCAGPIANYPYFDFPVFNPAMDF